MDFTTYDHKQYLHFRDLMFFFIPWAYYTNISSSQMYNQNMCGLVYLFDLTKVRLFSRPDLTALHPHYLVLRMRKWWGERESNSGIRRQRVAGFSVTDRGSWAFLVWMRFYAQHIPSTLVSLAKVDCGAGRRTLVHTLHIGWKREKKRERNRTSIGIKRKGKRDALEEGERE